MAKAKKRSNLEWNRNTTAGERAAAQKRFSGSGARGRALADMKANDSNPAAWPTATGGGAFQGDVAGGIMRLGAPRPAAPKTIPMQGAPNVTGQPAGGDTAAPQDDFINNLMAMAMQGGSGSGGGGGGGGGGVDINSLMAPYALGRQQAQAAAHAGRAGILQAHAAADADVNKYGAQATAQQGDVHAQLAKDVAASKTAGDARLAEAQRVASANGVQLSAEQIGQLTGSNARSAEIGTAALGREGAMASLIPGDTQNAHTAVGHTSQAASGVLETNLAKSMANIAQGEAQTKAQAQAQNAASARSSGGGGGGGGNPLNDILKVMQIAKAKKDLEGGGAGAATAGTSTKETGKAAALRAIGSYEGLIKSRNPRQQGPSFATQAFQQIVSAVDNAVVSKSSKDPLASALSTVQTVIDGFKKDHKVGLSDKFLRSLLTMYYGGETTTKSYKGKV